MNNLLVSLNKLIKNKNTITILGIILILGLLYFGYNRTVNNTINPISVPIAKEQIPARKEITINDITYTKVAAIMVNDSVIRSASDIVGKYTNVNVTIPAGSMFYKSWIVKKDEVPGNWIEEVKETEGYEAYYLSTDVTKTLGNNVIPGSIIDIYMMTHDNSGQLMYGKLLENIEVLVVHDSSGRDVFANASNAGTPSKIGFGLSHEYYVLLTKAEHLSGITLTIAPQGMSSQMEKDINVGSQTLRDFVDARSITLTDESQNQETNKGDTKEK